MAEKETPSNVAETPTPLAPVASSEPTTVSEGTIGDASTTASDLSDV